MGQTDRTNGTATVYNAKSNWVVMREPYFSHWGKNGGGESGSLELYYSMVWLSLLLS